MEEMIKYILNMDKTARELTEKAEQKKAEAKASLPARKEKLRSEYLQRANVRVAKMLDEEKQFLQDSLLHKKDEYAIAIDNLEKLYLANKECWIKDIVSHVTKYYPE